MTIIGSDEASKRALKSSGTKYFSFMKVQLYTWINRLKSIISFIF